MTLNIQKIRKDFPILSQIIRGKPLVYLDNAATTQKPQVVLDRLTQYYEKENANIHRGVHFLSERATEEYEKARRFIQKFLNAKFPHEIIFTRGTTEGINLIASSFGKKFIREGDEILISALEHHSNIVPWQILCEEKGAKLKVIPINLQGEIIFEEFEKLLTHKVKLLSLLYISNALGTVNPVKKMIKKAHEKNIPVLIDGAQSTAHLKVDVQALDCDFYAFSGHKTFGPTGIGVLYGKEKWLEEIPPYQGGGDMIASVSFEKTTYNVLPYKFEAGTPNIAGAIALQPALEYLENLGLDQIANHEAGLLSYAIQEVSKIDQLRFIGQAKEKASVLSFIFEDIHPHDIGTVLDSEGIAIRTGHHCAMPVMTFFKVPATARASFAFYNTRKEVDILVKGLEKVRKVFS
ncbi:MAG: cysteine desulfurase [Deltaproteobacteria bacterium]|nr:cysteine desulfurase [Deltaproteobacteria bacterium]